MQQVNRLMVLFAVLVVLMVAGPANAADPVLTFGFSDLTSSFDAGSLLFSASDHGDTAGDVTRVDPLGNALFDGMEFTGFFSLEINVLPSPPFPTTDALVGSGTLEITDVDGDTLAGSVSGIWIYNGSANFIGTIDSLAITTDDSSFNGTPGTSASLAGLAGLFEGNVMTLAFGNWFTDGGGVFQDFSDVSALSQGAIVPEPATLCLLAFGALAIAGRRRR